MKLVRLICISPLPQDRIRNPWVYWVAWFYPPCLLEPFRNPVDRDGIRSCIAKQFVIYSELQRQTKSGDSPPQIPFLWILTPTASPELLSDCGASLNLDTWMEGIYFYPNS
jgi:hypothetical protein